MPPMTFNAVRQLMAALVLTPVAMHGLRSSGYLSPKSSTQGQIDYRKKRLLKAGVLCGLFMLIGTATQQIGLLTVSAGKSGFISSIYIVFTPLFSVFVGSRAKRRTVLCIALAMVGFAVMSLKGGLGGATAGDWLTLVSAAGFAAQIVAVNCFVDKDNAVLISQAQFFFCGAAGLVIALIAEGPTLAAVFCGSSCAALPDFRADCRRIHPADHRSEIYGLLNGCAHNEPRGGICDDIRRHLSA